MILDNIDIIEKNTRSNGLEHTKNKGKKILGRKPEPLPNCRNNCNENIDDGLHAKLFELYWFMNDLKTCRAYMANLITSSNKKVVRKKETHLKSKRHKKGIPLFNTKR